MRTNTDKKQVRISRIDITTDKITGRGGVAFFSRYVEHLGFYSLFTKTFGHLKTSGKGLTCHGFIKQILTYFLDGSDMAIAGFDRRKKDQAYAASLECNLSDLASSHQIKRFFSKFQVVGNLLFRKILAHLFIWRLHIEKPKIIVLFGDTMVMNNDDATQREGVELTYKRKKGFHPLHLCWGPYLVDVIFRKGSAHSNHGNDFTRAVARITALIRKRYADVPIIVVTDSGFLSDANFTFFEEKLKIHYICVGKKYQELRDYVAACDPALFQEFATKNTIWRYIEFGNQLKSWSTLRRCIFTSRICEETGQLSFDFNQTDLFIYTNIGQDKDLTDQLIRAGGAEWLQPVKIIAANHQRGKDELTHRSLKEFATRENLPFEKFAMNRAWYHLLAISHFLFEAYKRDVTYDVLPVTAYPNTFRRRLIDFAAKIVSSGGHILLKVTRTLMDDLKLKELWSRCLAPPPIALQ